MIQADVAGGLEKLGYWMTSVESTQLTSSHEPDGPLWASGSVAAVSVICCCIANHSRT